MLASIYTDKTQMRFSRYYLQSALIFLIGTILFLYVIIKANYASFTHDESFTYLHYCHQSFMEIISFSDWYTNNHILNSLFMKYSEQVFGNSELALRLPNLLLLLVYMLYSYCLFKDKNILFTIMIFLLLCTNYILMDLFGMARGYGMSCGFMVMSLYHFIEYLKNYKKTNLFLFHLGALLASLSNFTLITFYLASLLVYNLIMYLHSRLTIDKKFRFIQTNSIHIFPLLIVTIILYEPLRRFITYANLDFGGKNGFFADTVTHLIRNTFHGVNISPSIMFVLNITLILILLISLFIIFKNAVQKKKHLFQSVSRAHYHYFSNDNYSSHNSFTTSDSSIGLPNRPILNFSVSSFDDPIWFSNAIFYGYRLPLCNFNYHFFRSSNFLYKFL